MKKAITLITLLILTAIPTFLFADMKTDLNEFFKLFDKNYTPTLKDYLRFTTEEDYVFYEGALEEQGCKQKGFKDCSEYQRERERNAAKEASLYYAWLRTKLPLSPKIQILKIKTIRRKEDSWTYKEIVCKFDDTKVTITYAFENDSEKPSVDVETINGKSVVDMFEKNVK